MNEIELKSGFLMPALGLGTFQMEPGEETYRAVSRALSLGYRLIDTAALYMNEQSVGEALRDSGLTREEFFVTTKVWNEDQGYNSTIEACQASLEALSLDWVDLYLIHWPVTGLWQDTWRALIELQKRGLCRSIGVSNFTEDHLRALKENFSETPAVNQVEFHPFVYRESLFELCRTMNIHLQAYTPLVKGERHDHPVLQTLADTHYKTPAQILLRWNIERGNSVLPKSIRGARLRENLDVFDFELAPSELKQLDSLACDYRICWNPYEA